MIRLGVQCGRGWGGAWGQRCRKEGSAVAGQRGVSGDANPGLGGGHCGQAFAVTFT